MNVYLISGAEPCYWGLSNYLEHYLTNWKNLNRTEVIPRRAYQTHFMIISKLSSGRKSYYINYHYPEWV